MPRTVRLGDVVHKKTGTINPTASPSATFTYIDVAAVDNQSKTITTPRIILGADAPSRARKLVRAEDILVATVRPGLNAVAKVPSELDGQVASTGFCVLRPIEGVCVDYLFFYVKSRFFIDSLTALVSGALYPAVTDSQVLSQRLPLPSVEEQRRIVDILSRAEGIVRLRWEAEKKAAELIPALFVEMFGDPERNENAWPVEALENVARIISGVTKGRRIEGADMVELPYMRVANVKDGHLDLSEVKTIAVRPTEIDKYRLQIGDLLLTEGGDPDKLGRGALWAGEIETCLHQNHVFKVRADADSVLPEYLAELTASAYGKAYFFRVAKKTTGIASINRTQLGQFPVPLPPLPRQRQFVQRVEAIRALQAQQAAATAKAQASFDALLAQAFPA